ncbi:MAG: hypothetical protein GWN30_33020 [Gammaproteobacteria bacterium]|nr:hypothetical protein [Gammaproteobacteria bacterium]
MNYHKMTRIWVLILIAILLVGCGPIEQRLADGTAVAAGQQGGQPFAEQPLGDGSGGGGAVSSAQQTADAWEKTLQASLDALLSLTPEATLTPSPPAQDVTVTDIPIEDEEDSTPTIDSAKLTALAQTLTEVAVLSATPTLTPSPTATNTVAPTDTAQVTPSPTEVPCLAFRFVAHVTYPPGTEVDPSTSFYKSWQVQNVGTCTWTGNYALVYDSGFQLGGTSPLRLGSGVSIAPNQYVTLTIQLWTPPQSGTYTSTWLLQDPDGNTFGGGANQDEPLLVRVVVPGDSPPEFTNPVSTSPPFYTSTPTP